MTRTAAVILTGGRARRLGGADKAAVRIGEATLLEHAIAAASECDPVVVVGPVVAGLSGVRFAREEPAGGGPAAGIAAGLAALESNPAWVLVLACDMPRVAQAVPALLAALGAAVSSGAVPAGTVADGAWGVDADGRAQPLCAVYRRESLETAVHALGATHGASMRALTAGLAMIDVPVGHAARDADTWDDVRALREEQP